MTRSTAESRRPLVAASALIAFSRGGYHATTVADVAREARISSAYVFKLFPSKERLFVAALEHCFDMIVQTLTAAAEDSREQSPGAVLDSMRVAYAHLIGDRALLMLQVHAQSAADVIEVGQALRSGLSRVARLAKTRSGADDGEVQRFVAYGQLCHLIVTSGIDDTSDEWTSILSAGIYHPD